MKVISNLSIRRKIVLIIMTVCTVSLLVASAVFVSTDRVNAHQSAAQNLRTLAKVIAANNSAAILLNDQVAARENLGFLKHQAHIQAAAL
jgi:CHASE3 domain sensor protein